MDPIKVIKEGTIKKHVGRKTGSKRLTQLIQSIKVRSHRARQLGNHIHSKVEEFMTNCGGTAYLVLKYEGARAKYCWQKGEFFCLDGDGSEIPTQVETVMTENVTSQTSQQSQLSNAVSSEEYSSLTSTERTTRPRPAGSCSVCRCDKVQVAGFEYDTEFIGCDFDGCESYAHIECLGFMDLTVQDIEKLPLRYCDLHRLVIREMRRQQEAIKKREPVKRSRTRN